MRRISVFVSLLAAALLVLAACGGDSGGEAAPEEDLSAFSDPAACNAAFEELSQVADLQEEDLDLAVRACGTTEDWEDAADAYPGVLTHANKMLPLSNRCRAIDDAPICRGLGGYLKKGSDTPGFGLGN